VNIPVTPTRSSENVPRRVRILIVEDERLVAMSLHKQLTTLGYEIAQSVASGQAAIEAAANHQPDLILMDVRLEGPMDGIEAATEIRRARNIPVIYLTAFSSADILERAKITEPFGYILKPFNERELHVVIETALFKHRMEAERAVLQERENRRQHDRLSSLATLAAGIAHEINNPIGTILLAAEMGMASEKHVPQALTSIIADAKRCGDIVRNVLSFARGETIERAPTELNAIVETACASVAGYLSSRNCSLDLSLATDLPTVEINSRGIGQVLENLLRNAADASDAGDTIDVRTIGSGDLVRIRVRDQGAGIDPDILPRICEPFYTTRRNLGGTGLGLSIAHGIVADHQGSLRFESNPGEGTTVTVELPAG
jgi:signal transduction histidine kinase